MTGQTAAERIAELKAERDRARGIAVALEQRLAVVEQTAREAVAAVGIGGHSHWREGGTGGRCAACEAAALERVRLTTALDPEAGP